MEQPQIPRPLGSMGPTGPKIEPITDHNPLPVDSFPAKHNELTTGEQKVQDKAKQRKVQKLWLKRLRDEEKAHKDLRDRLQIVDDVFHSDMADEKLFVPLYWSVVGVEHVGVYSNQPVPDVRPRNELNNPLYRDVAQLIQRGLNYCVGLPSFDENMHRTVDDFLAVALGNIRVKVDSIIETEISQVPTYGQDPYGNTFQTGMQEQQTEQIKDQTLRWEYVPWRRFGWQPCNNWKHCDYIYYIHSMTQADIKKRFGKTVSASSDPKDKNTKKNLLPKHYDIYEIWCKSKKEVLFIAKGEDVPLETIPDPLELIGFYPGPAPMFLNLQTEELIPQPDYDYIEAYDVELNRLQERRMGIMEQIKATGAFDSGLPELSDMITQEDGEYKPIPNLIQRFNAAGGKEGAIFHMPLQEKASVLAELTNQIGFVKSQVDEILGISDIVRGVTAASETATAQEIKGRWVGVRLTRKREIVQWTVKDMMRIMSQLLASHITPENLQRMTQMQITDEMMQILGNDMMMEFVIDIETDSTVAKDEFKERETHQEMLNGVAQYAQSVLPQVQSGAMPAGIASAILAAALRPYTKYDRTLEEELKTLPQTSQQLQGQQQQIEQLTQEKDQATQQAQQWEQMANILQQQSTEAATKQKTADAEKKKAETRKIMKGLPDDGIQAQKTVSEIKLNVANADAAGNRGQQ